MDFRKLSKISLPESLSNNSSAVGLTEIPTTILEALVPGYSLVSKYVLAAFGIDISIFVSLAVILLAVTKGGQYLYIRTSRAFRYLFLSSIYIDEGDDLFDMLMDWLAATHATSSRRSVRAKTQRGNKASDDFDAAAGDALTADGMFDYNIWSARTPPRYEPYYGWHILWHNSRPVIFHRMQRGSVSQAMSFRYPGDNNDDDLIQLDCIGRSVEPLRDMLKSVKLWSLQRQRHTTTIRHPTPKDRARFAGSWSKTFSRPSRPMETVILDNEQKDTIINDMNEYLHPTSPKWYATRGIPYRRGYLFHGPPGTGKTSLSFALAGIFGLEIYVISLQDPAITEGDLMQLFNTLPKRCIVLLEDVDAAGLIRDGKSGSDNGKFKGRWRKSNPGEKDKETSTKEDQASESSQKPKKDEEFTLKDLAKELKSISAPRGGEKSQTNPNRQPGTGISLSGLLNAIDGVASHEGRVLIMTTNHPEDLDAALVRPGRVDRRVEFTMAAREQIRELFYRMYVSTEDQFSPELFLDGKNKKTLNGFVNGHLAEKLPNGHTEHDGHLSSTPASVEELALEFAARIPDDTFTPAEIQNHLLKYKKEPQKAVETVDRWIEEISAEKENESKSKDPTERIDEEEEGKL